MDVRGLLELYIHYVLLPRTSYRTTLRAIHNHVFEPLLDLAVEALTPLEVARWFQGIARTPTQSNRARKVLRAAYRWGLKMRLLACEFPDPGLPFYPERDRDRVLSAQERDTLLAGLDQMPVKLRAFLLVLWLCGPRPSELCRMRWADVDLVRATWHKPTTKNGRPHTVPLPQQTVIALAHVRQAGPWVFYGYDPQRPWAVDSPRQAWNRWRRLLGLSGVWLYDLRRTCATELHEAGASLLAIRQLLNHQSLQYTHRYARVQLDPLRQAVQARADQLLPGQFQLECSTTDQGGGPCVA